MSSITGYGYNDITVNAIGGTAATVGTDYRIVIHSGTNTEAKIEFKGKGDGKRISPRLYFKYVKSKLNQVELAKLKARLTKLQKLTQDAFDIGQIALYEEYAKMIAIAVRESEAAVCGYKKWIHIDDIEKFKTITKESDGTKSVIYLKKLEDYSRSVPASVKEIIWSIQDKGLFDQLWVLHIDYTHEAIKSNKEKIREKDPILFGTFNYDPKRYFYCTDWVDQFCDLTLDQFIDKLKTKDQEYKIQETPDIDQDFIDQIKKEVAAREERLKNTKASNFRAHMADEDKELEAKKKGEKKQNKAKSLFAKLFKGKQNA